ncbi:serine hydrolase domain-containing protein [Aquiflexum sp.]|uniref:serine hydrolase domain-containing protein n=1 Tax=Aquiflexum sp. TaxID=1872584 RepID=UPI0035946D91
MFTLSLNPLFYKCYKFFLTAVFIAISGHCFSIPIQVDSVENKSLSQLKHEVELLLNDYNGLSVGIALVRKDQLDWIVGIGNIEDRGIEPVSVNTIFRTASLSKMFVALAILKLHEEGLLSLEDKIKDIVPDVEFKNPWEETSPVRIIHLLEHTTGWDEMHLVERVHNQTLPIALKNALEFHPHSRKSRWVPGSRMAYCNSGYAVAAYIIEKVSGLPFEKYVDAAILKQLKMDHTTFFNDSIYQQWGAKTYNWDMEKVDYKHELYRPSSALNSSPKDMAQVLKILLNRGALDGLNLFDKETIERMEVSQSTPGAQEGLELGYGLGNYTTNYNGFTYHGHDGAMDGGLSQLAYLPEHGVGHVILLNANNVQAMQRIEKLLREFETEKLPVPEPNRSEYIGQIDIETGFYLAINPRNQNLFYQDVLFAGIEKIKFHKNTVYRSWLLPGSSSTYHAVSAKQFSLGSTNKIGLVEATDPIEGKILYSENSVLKPISSLRVFGQLTLFGLWIAMTIAGLFSFFIFTVLYAFNREKYNRIIRISLLPTITSVFIIITFFLRFYGFDNADLLFSKPTFLTIALLSCSILFVVGAIASAIAIFKSRRSKIQRTVLYPNMILSCLHFIASIYLIFHGFIPLITWV